MTPPRAVLITGVFGSGKTALVEELAEILDDAGAPYAAIDLDWLMWFSPGDTTPDAELDVLLSNLQAVVANYLGVGIRYFLLALFVQREDDLRALRQAVAMEMAVVRLECSRATIEKRLGAAATRGRAEDLRRALVAIEERAGCGLEDVVVQNEGPISHTAEIVLAHLGWSSPTDHGAIAE